LSLPVLARITQPAAFVVLYLLSGLSDVLDGYIARRFHVESDLGGKLDGLADILLFLCAFVSVVFLMGFLKDSLAENIKLLATIGAGIAFKVFSSVLTYVRFKQWNGIHTYTFKALGTALFFALPVCVLMQEINYWLIFGASVAIALASIEETIILCTSKTYNINHKGILVEKWLARRKPS
jgi:CDP-diacylglycerol--glycerol-3-phosphate 3-phosphatidyltransferase